VTQTVVPPSNTSIFDASPMGMYFGEGPMDPPGGPGSWGASNWIAESHTTYIQRITVWECPEYKTGACINNPVITTAP
jgi:hypothetical protein